MDDVRPGPSRWARLASGVACSLGLLSGGLLVTAGVAGTAAACPDHNAQFGLTKMQGTTPVVRDWDCGCPEPARRPRNADEIAAVATFSAYRYGYPTRCLYDNHSSRLANGGRPVNDRGTPYPSVPYPPTYPASMQVGGGPDIPFPGWPQGNTPTSQWDSTRRRQYRADYEDVYKATAPARYALQGGSFGYPVVKPPKQDPAKAHVWPWYYWQIHHIQERTYGGQDHHENLVPAYTYPNSKGGPNKHNEFTQWWNHITTDAEVLAKTASFAQSTDKLHEPIKQLRMALETPCPDPSP